MIETKEIFDVNNAIQITSARPEFKDAGALNYIAIGNLCHVMVGSDNQGVIEHYMQKLYQMRKNRFSYEHTLAAMIDGQVAGLITCMPYRELEKALVPTVVEIIALKRIFVVPQLMIYYKSIFSLINLKEAEEDEYHVSMLSVSSDFQRLGVGQTLLKAAENIAREKGFDKITLTVNQYNDKANALYEKLGYEKVGETTVARETLNKMRKYLN